MLFAATQSALRFRTHAFRYTPVAAAAAACVAFIAGANIGSGSTRSLVQAGATYSTSTNFGGMTHTTVREGDGTIVISPTDEATQSATVVICHGLGDTSEGFADVAEHLASQMPHVKFILPTAPTQPVTMNMGMAMPSWYDIVGLDERSNEKCHGINRSQDTLRAILAKEHARGLPYNRMTLAGFSQGGALGLYTGLQLDPNQKLAGILVLSGYLAGGNQFRLTKGLEDTPILHCHGTADPLVLYKMANKSKEMLTSKGVTDYTIKSYPIQHTVIPQEIADAAVFLKKVLPPNSETYIRVKDPSEMSVKELKEAIRRAGLGSKAVGLMEKQEFVKLLQDHRGKHSSK